MISSPADQPTRLLKLLGRTEEFYFGPSQTETINVFPARKLLKTTLEQSGVTDRAAWQQKAKDTVRLLFEDKSLNLTTSRVQKKKDATTTFLDMYARVCREMFPPKVVVGHKAVPILEKEAYQRKVNGKAVRGYRYRWNQDAIETVCNVGRGGLK